MLAKSLRLTRKQLEEIIKGGKVTHSPLFTVRYTKDDKLFPKCGIATVASVKIAKTSVLRHRIRRIIYSATETFVSDIKPGYAIAIFAKSGIADMKSADLIKPLKEIFVKAGLMR